MTGAVAGSGPRVRMAPVGEPGRRMLPVAVRGRGIDAVSGTASFRGFRIDSTKTVKPISARPSPRTPPRSGDAGERRLEVGDEVAGVLEADGEPHDVLRHRERRAAHRGVRHLGRVADEGLDAAERLGEL